MTGRLKNPIVVALDVDDVGKAEELVTQLSGQVGGFKVGPRLTFRSSPGFLKKLSQQALLFFDHKFFDIPSTTVSAVKVAAEMGASWVTVHGLSGPECMSELIKLETEIQKNNPLFRVLVVTVLTSFSENTLPPIWKSEPIGESVISLVEMAWSKGLRSFVCSAHEIGPIKKKWPDAFLVVPGIRPENASAGDQKRTATPQEALNRGASALVIGRPVIEATDPLKVVRSVLASIAQ